MSTFDDVDPLLVDVFPSEHDGYPDDLAAEDTDDVLRDVCGAATTEFPKEWEIDPKDWDDVANENDKRKSWAMNFVDRFTNQGPGNGRRGTHECTCHSMCVNFSVARNRARGLIYPDGPRKDARYEESGIVGSVWPSPLSVYNEANPSVWGGANVRQVLEIAIRRGILPDTIQPADYGFKHAIHGTAGKGGKNQGSGPWVPLSQMPAGWEETARMFRPDEVIFPSCYEEAVCLLLHGFAVSVGRHGHAVPWCGYMAGKRLHPYPDSYDVIRYDSERTARSAWRGSFSIISTTLPNDWSRPAAG